MSSSPTALAVPRMAGPATRDDLLRFLIAYLQLLVAHSEATEQGISPRDAAVGYRRFTRMGIGTDVLLWMLYQAHIDHLGPGASGWSLKPSAVVGDESAFALTALGATFAEFLVGALLAPEKDDEFAWASGLLRVGALVPRFDKEERLLVWGRHALKSFRQPSGNQELILLTAEELGWPKWFDDPLPRRRDINAKVRLHDAIKNLNRHQRPHLAHFKGDGTGARVGWELK